MPLVFRTRRAGACASDRNRDLPPKTRPKRRSALAAIVTGAFLASSALAEPTAFHNFESPQTRPAALSDDGHLLFVVNTPDQRLAVFDALELRLVDEIPVGLEPVAVAVRPGAREVWVVNHLSDTVDVVTTSGRRVVQSLVVGDEPASIAFTPDGAIAVVTVSQEDRVVIVDARNRRILHDVALEVAGIDNTEDPRAVTISRDGAFAYVVPFESGNRTRGDGISSTDPDAAKGRTVRDPALSDVDVFVIRIEDGSIVGRVEGVGTLLSNAALSRDGRSLYVVGRDARNTVSGAEALAGHPTINRLTVVDLERLEVERRVDLDGPDYRRDRAVAQPTDIVVDVAGRTWLAAQGNGDVVVFGRDGRFLDRIAVGAGPRGLAFDAKRARLYVVNRIDHEVVAIDTRARAVIARASIGFDPTPELVRAGQRVLYSAERSGDGTQACVSCHADAHHDNVVWNVGTEVDPKGPMFTQSLRGLADNAPYHWRGEKPTLLDFAGAFEELLGGEPLPSEENETLAAYMASIEYPPNPNRRRDGSLRHELARCGQQLFMGVQPVDCPPPEPHESRQGMVCVSCHALPDGTNNLIIPRNVLLSHDDMEVTQLRGLPDKVGFAHDGRYRSIVEQLSQSPPFPPFPEVDKRAMQAFMFEFDNAAQHAAVGTSRTLHRSTCPDGVPDAEIVATVAFLEERARAGDVDLTVHGKKPPQGEVHLEFDPGSGLYLYDRVRPATATRESLIAAACSSRASLMFVGAPVGRGVRARDRDLDRLVNAYERNQVGTSPADPDSDGDGLGDGEEWLDLGTDPTRADTDGDTVSDGSELDDGTDPRDASSWLRFVSLASGEDGVVQLTWSTAFGKRYRLKAYDGVRPPADGGAYRTLYRSPTPETESPEGTESFLDLDVAPESGEVRFYRIEAD